jgi:hypothetical protein
MKKPATSGQQPAANIDDIIKWIDDKFEETHAEIIIRGQIRNYIIVPHKIKNYEN